MMGWFVENSLGVCPPVLARPLKPTVTDSVATHTAAYGCSVSYILSIVPRAGGCRPRTLIVRGYQWNDGIRSRVDFSVPLSGEDCYSIGDVRETRMTTFACHDRTILHMFIVDEQGETTMYYTQFSGCCSLRVPRVPLHRVELFHEDGFYRIDRTPSHDLVLNSLDIRSKHQGLLHHNWDDPGIPEEKSSHVLSLDMEGKRYRVYGFCCVFCIRKFESISSLVFHTSRIHPNYRSIYKHGTFFLTKAEAVSTRGGRTWGYFSKGYRRRGLVDVSKPAIQQGDKGAVNGIWSIANLSSIVNGEVREQVHLSPQCIELMERWNDLRLHGNELMEDVARLIKEQRNNPLLVDFLLVLYHKSVLNHQQVMDFAYSLAKSDQRI